MFYNAHNFTIENSTFNDIAGDQHISTVTNTYHNAQIIEITSSRTTVPAYGTDQPIQSTISLPTSEPFKSFISLVIEIQRTLFPIGSFISEPSLFKPLEGDLLMIIKSAAYLGRILELVTVNNSDCADLFGSTTMKEQFELYTIPLQKATDEIHRYKEGLKFTLIGPIWRRVLWSVMWTMSSGADIGRIVNTIRAHLADCYAPGMEYLGKLGTAIWWSVIEKLPAGIVSDIESLRDSISQELPATNQIRFRTITIDFGFHSLRVPLSSYATYKNIVTLLKYNTDHIKDNIDGFIDPSDEQAIGPSRFEELIRSEKQDKEVVIVPVSSDVVDVFFQDKKDICPCCRTCHGRSEGGWSQCDSLDCRYMVIGQAQPVQNSATVTTHRSIRLSARDDVNHANRYTKVKYAGIEWSELISATSITNIQGYTKDILFILHHLHLAGSPVEEISIADWKTPNILIPKLAIEAFKLSDNELIHLPNLRRLVISGVNSFVLEMLSLPKLRYFKAMGGISHETSARWSMLTFMKRAPLLSTLDFEIQRLTLLPDTTQFLCHTISSLPNLMEMHVHIFSNREWLDSSLLHDLVQCARLCCRRETSPRSKAKGRQKKRSGRRKLEMIAIWFDWADSSTIQVSEPWALSTSDCGCVARLYINDL